MKTSIIKISKAQIIKSEKARHRAELIACGHYNIFRNQTFKSKKDYSRKNFRIEF